MTKVSEIECLYIDFDAFFASVEKQLCPEIRHLPVGVTALDSEYSSFITRCYMAKAAGIKRGTKVRDARAMCPEISVQVARPDVYVKIHNRILEEVDRHIPVTKVWSIDEVECRLTGRERFSAPQLAERIRAGLAKAVGPHITPSIGLSANQFLAKVAADLKKPNGLTVLHPRNLPGPLLDLKLTDLPGISSGMSARLDRAGVQSVEDFWNLAPKHARAIWGNIEGERMWAQLHGHRVERPETKKAMFGHSRVLTKGWNTPDKALDCLSLLTVKAAYRLRRAGYLCRALSVALRPQDGERWSAQTSFAPCSDDQALSRHMRALFKQGRKQFSKNARIKTVYVLLHDITKPQDVSGDLFDFADDDTARSQRWGNIMSAMDGLNAKHGKALVTMGPRTNLPGGFAGGKIAFGRVPEAEDFI